ncbi:hypothetical protein HK096_006749, partial [Nowakowskiella sp. JEL0078]
AVDPPTARHLFEQCILSLLKGRTRILISHAIPLVLPKSDYVVVLKSGEVVAQGTPKVVTETKDPVVQAILGVDAMLAVQIASEFDTNDVHPDTVDLEAIGKQLRDMRATKIVEKESRAVGSINLQVYDFYRKATGGWHVVGAWFFCVCIFVMFIFLRNSWISYWTNNINQGYEDKTGCSTTNETVISMMSDYKFSNQFDIQKFTFINWKQFAVSEIRLQSNFVEKYMRLSVLNRNELTTDNISLNSKEIDEKIPVSTFVLIYVLLAAACLIADNMALVMMYSSAYFATKKLHKMMLDGVFGTSMRFFEKTPTGRIINRFSRDIQVVDQDVQWGFMGVARCIVQLVVTVFIITSVVPSFLLFLPILLWIFSFVSNSYLNVSRELKRLESVSKSPIYSLFSEILNGVSTIRSYGQEERFEKLNNEKLNLNHRAYFYLSMSGRWLGFRMSMITSAITLVTGIGLVLSGISPGWSGFCLANTMGLTGMLLWFVNSQAQMEMGMNAVERIQEYSLIEPEPPAFMEPRPPVNWPSEGAVIVSDLTLKYSPELSPVLSNLNFSIKGGHKVGIVGRTGAGKSTLSLAFFRILPFSNGTISIDGLDIQNVGLHDLRSRLTIIPQDPVLFSGNLRQAMDPLGEHEDEAIWTSLNRVNFLDSMQQHQDYLSKSFSFPEIEESTSEGTESHDSTGSVTLEYNVAENGSNFSQGQRQLLCLARALLRRSKLVILDEATASVDNATDVVIQKVIRTELDNVTILTIAHRIRTVIDFDRILVLDKGCVAEYDTPLTLLQNENGMFKKMAEESGEFAELVALAQKKENLITL